jgi:uncharacterized protein Smg (DUF494 family)
MSKKVTIEDVKDVLLAQGFEHNKVNNAIEELKAIIEEEAADKPKEKKAKSTFYVIANTSELDEDQKKFLGQIPLQVVKVKADIPHTSVIEHISAAIRQNNIEQQGKKKPKIASTIFSGLERLSARFFKTEGVSRLSKEIVMLIETDNSVNMH